MDNQPKKLKGSIHAPPWSSNRLSELYKRFANSGPVGEIWESSCEEDTSALLEDGTSFGQYVHEMGLKVPPLVKLISAKTPLSVQVHPDPIAAAKHGGTDKSEIWYVLDAEEDASILYGTKDGVCREELILAINKKDTLPCLKRITVRPGDVIMIPYGMVHSLGGGITVLEVQNKNGTTYRLQDLSGDRETHPEEASDSIRIISEAEAAALAFTSSERIDGAALPGRLISSTPDFAVSVVEGATSVDLPAGGVYMFCARGGGYAAGVSFSEGESVFFPDATDCVSLTDAGIYIFVK